MLDDEFILWDEGLFVRPQHLQAMQRQSVRRHGADRRLLVPFPYGVVAAEPDVVGNRVWFDALHVVLRDGTVVHHGRNAVVRPFDLARTDAGRLTVHVGVRSDAEGFRTHPHPDVPDETTGGDPAVVVGRQIDAHLFAGEPPDPGVWESLPVLRFVDGRVDEAFAPPCFRLSACRPLRWLVEDVLQRARSARDAPMPVAGTEAITRGEVQLLARHRAISHFAAALSHELRDESLTPFAAYGTCLRLLAAIRAADAAGDPVESEFDHDDPWPAFAKLHADLRAALAVSADPPRQYDLRPLDPPFPPDLLGCQPDLDLLTAGTHSAVLAVAADRPEDAEVVQQLLALRNLRVAAPGALVAFQAGLLLPWQVMEAGTEGLPPIHTGPGLTRFVQLLVQAAAPGWQRVRADRTLAVRYPTAVAGRRELRLRFRLYLTANR